MQDSPPFRKNHLKISDIPELPPLPSMAQLILQEINDENIDINHLAGLIEKDPGLLARIVGLANSAYFGYPQRIYTISDAIIKVLGLNMVRSLALSIVMGAPFNVQRCRGFRIEEYWSMAMLSANVARKLVSNTALSEELNYSNAYMCGLLHNLGLLVMVHAFPEDMSQVFARETDVLSPAFIEAQRELLDMDHNRAGAILARQWQLPDEIVAVIRHHHDPTYRGSYWKTALVVGASVRLAQGLHRMEEELDCREDVLEALDLSRGDVEGIIEGLRVTHDQVESLASILNMQ